MGGVPARWKATRPKLVPFAFILRETEGSPRLPAHLTTCLSGKPNLVWRELLWGGVHVRCSPRAAAVGFAGWGSTLLTAAFRQRRSRRVMESAE